jgi:hypothetical protein
MAISTHHSSYSAGTRQRIVAGLIQWNQTDQGCVPQQITTPLWRKYDLVPGWLQIVTDWIRFHMISKFLFLLFGPIAAIKL